MGEENLVMDIKSGIIFVSGENQPEVQVGKKIERLKFSAKVLRRGGIILVGLAVGMTWAILWPVISEELKYTFGQTKLGRTAERISNTQLKVGVVTADEIGQKPDWIVPDWQYSIYIPKILAKAKVIENVDAGDKPAYQKALRQGVAEAAGLAHPGEIGTTYLFAHSVGSSLDVARYNAIFYLLDKLKEGDGVEIVYQNRLYKYQVETRKIIQANDVSYMVPQKEEEKLVLQTCYPPGTAWKRLIIVAKRYH